MARRRSKTKPIVFPMRVWFVLAVFGLATTALIGRMIELQVVDREFLQDQGTARHLREVPIPASRGAIFDRNGEPLAISTPVESLGGNPAKLLANPSHLPRLAAVLGEPLEPMSQRIARLHDREFVFFKRRATPDLVDQVLALGIPGVSTRVEYQRFYPSGEIAAQLIGMANVDDVGQEGIELAYDDWLSGTPGAKRVIRDRQGKVIENVDLVRAADPGKDLYLSIDRRVQYHAYRALKSAVNRQGADAGSLVLMDVNTAEVLALANVPSFNPNDRSSIPVAAVRNRVLTDFFEPGSVVKPLTIVAALESGRYQPDSPLDTHPGAMNIGEHRIHDVRNFGAIDLTGVITHSSNVGAAKVALSLPTEHLRDVFHRFGFGEVTGTGFPAESPGILPPATRLQEVEKATMSYGYGLSITPIQLAQAFAALGNLGRLRAPTLIRGATNPAQSLIDPALAETVLDMMETVTAPEAGGRRARVSHYRVAGKTGTARRAADGGYDDRYVASFVGLAPASDPRLVLAVVIHNPRGEAFYGGQVAAPLFAEIAEDALRILGVPPDDIVVDDQQWLVGLSP